MLAPISWFKLRTRRLVATLLVLAFVNALFLPSAHAGQPVDTTAPVLSAAAVNGSTLTLTYSENLDTTSGPAATDFTVTVGSNTVAVSNVAVAGNAVTLTLASPAAVGDSVSVSYAGGASPIQDVAGNDAAALTSQAVTNNAQDTTAPTLSAAAVYGSTLTLTYSENLDTTSVPATTDFVVTVAGTPVGVSGAAVAGTSVTLTLASAATEGAAVTVSYTVGASPIQDAAGNDVTALTSQAVVNNTPGANAELHVGANQTYATIQAAIDAAVAGNTVIVHDGTYPESLTISTPHLMIRSANGAGSTSVQFSGEVGIAIAAPNVTVEGLHLIANHSYSENVLNGIEIRTTASGAAVLNNIIDGNQYTVGIGVMDGFTGALTISGNTISNHGGAAVYGESLSDATVTVSGNESVNNGGGINFRFLTNTTLTISDNQIVNSSGTGIWIEWVGGDSPDSNEVLITGNTVGMPEGSTDTALGGDYNGIDVSNIDWDGHVVIAGNYVVGNHNDGVALGYLGQQADEHYGQAGYVAPVVEVRNNTINQNSDGIYQYNRWTNGVEVIISNNVVRENRYGGFNSHFDLNAILQITDNDFSSNGLCGIQPSVTIESGATLTIQGNHIMNNSDCGIGFYKVTSENVSVVGNTITGNGGAGLFLYKFTVNAMVTQNQFGGNTTAGISLLGQNNRILGNTFLAGAPGAPAVLVGNTATGNQIHYNEFLGGDSGIFADPVTQSVDATLNWWGDAAGPGATPSSQVSGHVTYSPWITGMAWTPPSISLRRGKSALPKAAFATRTSDSTVGSDPLDLTTWPLTNTAPGVLSLAANGTVTGASLGTATISTGLTFDPGLVVKVTSPPSSGGGGGGGGQTTPPPTALVTISASVTETRDATVSVSGTANPGAVVSVGGLTATASATGSWTAVVTLTEGANTITATNGSASQSVTVTRDSTPPVITLTASEAETFAESVTLSASTEAKATLTIAGEAAGTGSGARTVTLQVGSNTFTATARDPLGNEGSATVTVIRKEQPAPVPPVIVPLPTPTPVETPLKDISGHWAEAAILRLVGQGVVAGFEDQTFRPELTVTRAEFTAMLGRALRLKGSTDLGRFTDAAAIPDWARADVAAAVAAGIVQGRADGSFDPDAKITRAEAAVMIAGALRYKGLTATGQTPALSDFAAVPEWAKASVQAAVHNGIITGYEDGTFRYDNWTTRAQAAVMLNRLLDAR